MPRSRTDSKFEESNVDTFVQSCIDFEGNVSFAPTADFKATSGNVLVLLQEDDDAGKQAAAALPFWSDVAAVLDDAPGATAFVVGMCNELRVSVGVVPAKASRHNCAQRPDAITPMIAAAASNGKNVKELHVLSFISGPALPVVQAVAKGANRSFTAKDGKAEESYMKAGPAVTVYLATVESPQRFRHIATCTQLCMRLLDAPPCLLDTTTFAEIAEGYAKKLGFAYSEIRGEELREKGYGGAYGVGKAAEFPPALVTLQYKPAKEGMSAKEKIALVGKGIVYDTGGLSLKTPSTFMSKMKMDMGGAGAVFAGFVCCVLLETPHPMDCVLCLADNAVGPRSQRPDDILRMKSGVTVEIANTDAEGRLVLGDGVYHACAECGEEPAVVIDMATLTGAQLITTGKKHAGIFASTDEWEAKVVAAGKKSGDLTFPMLYCPEFHNPLYKSPVADFSNLCTRDNAVSSCAGMFIANNLPKAWKGTHVHLDIAGPAMDDKVGSGYGVALLAQLFGDC